MMTFLSMQVIPRLVTGFIRLIFLTCKVQIEGEQAFSSAMKEKGGVLALWHQHLLLMPYFVRQCAEDLSFVAAMSNSRDADALAGAANIITNVEALRVPHDARSQALRQIIEVLKDQKVLLITPDGPRGPAHEVKPGVIFAARQTKVPVYPFSWKADKFWQLGTWDGMMIPKPFSTITMKVGDRVEMSKKKAGEGRKESIANLERALKSVF